MAGEKVSPRYFTHLLSLDAPELDEIPGVKVLDEVEDRGISLVELTHDSSLGTLLSIRRRGYQLSYAKEKHVPELAKSK